jgi:hypothetical protein
VAEEVNLDQQSDRLRRVGKPPKQQQGRRPCEGFAKNLCLRLVGV